MKKGRKSQVGKVASLAADGQSVVFFSFLTELCLSIGFISIFVTLKDGVTSDDNDESEL